MKAKHTDLEKLEQLYKESGNQLVVLYGRRGCQKEELIKEFCDGKKFFYYRCRQASPEHQLEMMGEEISRQYKVSLSRQTYEEYFARIKSGDPSKLVVIIDEEAVSGTCTYNTCHIIYSLGNTRGIRAV